MHLVIALIFPLSANNLLAAASSAKVEKGKIKLRFKILIYILIKFIQLRLRDTGDELTRLKRKSKNKNHEDKRARFVYFRKP